MFGLFTFNVFLVFLLPKVGTYYFANGLKFETIIAIQNRATELPILNYERHPYTTCLGLRPRSPAPIYGRKVLMKVRTQGEGVPVSITIQKLLLL